MRGNQRKTQRVSAVAGEKPPIDAYKSRANKFYNVKQSGQTAAVVETVFRKPKAFANLHEYDDIETVDQVPTAIGFNSFDSADEVIEAKMKSRYYFKKPTEKDEDLPESEESKPPEKEKVLRKGEGGEICSSLPKQRHVPFHKVILRKVTDGIPNAPKVVDEQQIVVVPDEREPSMEEKQKQVKDQEEETEDQVRSNDRYGLGQSIFSDDDSCPPLWKSFSNEDDEKFGEGSAAANEKARRQIALNEARKLRALNSVHNIDDPTTLEVDMGVDPRLRRNTAQASGLKKASSIQDKSSSRKAIDSKVTDKIGQERAKNTSNRKDPVSVVSNSIVVSQPPPRKVAVKAMTFDRPFDDASYGSEGQSKASDDEKKPTVLSEASQQHAETEHSFAACVYDGLSNLANINYWIGEQDSSDGNQDGSEDESREAVNMSSNTNSKNTAKRDAKVTKSSPAIVSEITIPTPEVRNGGEPRMEDSVSILGLDKKHSSNETNDNRENRVPQKLKKRKEKSRAFGKILGRKTPK
ncbi:unnamed protein product [Cylindrotheca closterium]|uniref:Uncharacterized protein n=1 Tax=Cylindrotheca closterium TaxID=2856 RepID=A0AAD2FY36_9STRA|nr:unnamed protein product [Cylindrotheca closterium]